MKHFILSGCMFFMMGCTAVDTTTSVSSPVVNYKEWSLVFADAGSVASISDVNILYVKNDYSVAGEASAKYDSTGQKIKFLANEVPADTRYFFLKVGKYRSLIEEITTAQILIFDPSTVTSDAGLSSLYSAKGMKRSLPYSNLPLCNNTLMSGQIAAGWNAWCDSAQITYAALPLLDHLSVKKYSDSIRFIYRFSSQAMQNNWHKNGVSLIIFTALSSSEIFYAELNTSTWGPFIYENRVRNLTLNLSSSLKFSYRVYGGDYYSTMDNASLSVDGFYYYK